MKANHGAPPDWKASASGGRTGRRTGGTRPIPPVTFRGHRTRRDFPAPACAICGGRLGQGELRALHDRAVRRPASKPPVAPKPTSSAHVNLDPGEHAANAVQREARTSARTIPQSSIRKRISAAYSRTHDDLQPGAGEVSELVRDGAVCSTAANSMILLGEATIHAAKRVALGAGAVIKDQGIPAERAQGWSFRSEEEYTKSKS